MKSSKLFVPRITPYAPIDQTDLLQKNAFFSLGYAYVYIGRILTQTGYDFLIKAGKAKREEANLLRKSYEYMKGEAANVYKDFTPEGKVEYSRKAELMVRLMNLIMTDDPIQAKAVLDILDTAATDKVVLSCSEEEYEFYTNMFDEEEPSACTRQQFNALQRMVLDEYRRSGQTVEQAFNRVKARVYPGTAEYEDATSWITSIKKGGKTFPAVIERVEGEIEKYKLIIQEPDNVRELGPYSSLAQAKSIVGSSFKQKGLIWRPVTS